MLTRAAIRLFDFFKKQAMERYYRSGGSWGRVDDNADVAHAVSLIAERHYHYCLDVGAGLGHYAQAVAPLCDEVVLLDISQEAIAKARENLTCTPNVRYEVGNMRDKVRGPEKFDLIILGEVLYYLGDERFPREFTELIGNIAGLLEQGGRVLMVNYISPGRSKNKLKAYMSTFMVAGLTIENEEEFKDDKKTFVISVLKK